MRNKTTLSSCLRGDPPHYPHTRPCVHTCPCRGHVLGKRHRPSGRQCSAHVHEAGLCRGGDERSYTDVADGAT